MQVVAELPAWLPYEFPTAVKNRLSGSWAQYKGQAQRWFLLKFTGEDDEVWRCVVCCSVTCSPLTPEGGAGAAAKHELRAACHST